MFPRLFIPARIGSLEFKRPLATPAVPKRLVVVGGGGSGSISGWSLGRAGVMVWFVGRPTTFPGGTAHG